MCDRRVATSLDTRVHLTSTLGWFDDARAQSYMRELKMRADPILKSRGWRVLELKEFFPRDSRLLGLNVNRGQEVCVRFREPSNRAVFFPLEAVVGTLLHELVHCKIAPHNRSFWLLYHELVREEENRDLERALNLGAAGRSTGSVDASLLGRSTGLSSTSVGGVRLGGGCSGGASRAVPDREVLAAAALRRRQGELLEQSVSDLALHGCSQSVCVQRRRPRDESSDPEEMRCDPHDGGGAVVGGTVRTGSSSLLDASSWSCPRCQFLNHALLYPVCEICSDVDVHLEGKPHDDDVVEGSPPVQGEGTGRKSDPYLI